MLRRHSGLGPGVKKPPRKKKGGRRQRGAGSAPQSTRAMAPRANAKTPSGSSRNPRTTGDFPQQRAAVAAPVAQLAPSLPGALTGYSRIGLATIGLVLAPLIAAAAFMLGMPEGLPKGVVSTPAAPVLAALTTPPPLAATSTPTPPQVLNASAAPELAPVIDKAQSLPSIPAEPISASVAPETQIVEIDAPSDLIPAIAEENGAFAGRERRCELDDSAAAPGVLKLGPALRSEATWQEFGGALSDAARRQTREFVVYADSYRNLKFPLGDVSAQFGVCTDVVVRAYRAIGVDLQALVHQARVGTGDASIDHRRVEVLRRFFAAYGESLEASDLPEDYLPGDIVTYNRPQNTSSQSHIAIVSNVIGFSGRPLIVHNRGWGPQLEDALFVDRITGHYRYRGGSVRIAAFPNKMSRLRPLHLLAAAQLAAVKALVDRSAALKPHLKRASEAKANGRPKS